jgi:uncharacterized protein YbjQ (UPF0145 family)
MMAEARESAIQRMVHDAEGQGANTIVAMQFGNLMVTQNTAEVIAYGTAVKVE